MAVVKLVVTLVLALSLIVGAMAGCGGREDAAETGEQETDAAVGDAEEAAAVEGEIAAEESEAVGGGSLYVESFPPGADIMINGERAAYKTPHLFEDRAPGHYEVLVVLPGFVPEPKEIEVDVTMGSLDTLSFSMEGDPLASFVLMNKEPKEVWPRWSPKGDWIAFEAYYEYNRDIYVVPGVGGDPTRLTFDEAADFSPCWSPDGREIAFVSGRGGTIDLWAVNADGGEPRRLTTLDGAEDSPTWSPDGKWIAFEYKRNIWKLPLSGGEAEQVTKGPERHFYPAWSPDGEEIAFTASVEKSRQIWVVNVATGATRKIVDDKGWSYGPSWSADGRIIAFTRRSGRPADKNHEIWVVPAEGGQITQLTLDPLVDQYPSFSPDNKKLVWTKEGDIWVMTNLPDWLFEGS
jgi:TolB protein